MSESSGKWPRLLKGAAGISLAFSAVLVVRACLKNIKASKKGKNFAAVDALLAKRKLVEGDVQLPADQEGLLYNRKNREYASRIVKSDLGASTKRTEADISSEIFAHEFAADIAKPLKALSGKVPARFDIFGRLVEADIDEGEKRKGLFNLIERLFEWE